MESLFIQKFYPLLDVNSCHKSANKLCNWLLDKLAGTGRGQKSSWNDIWISSRRQENVLPAPSVNIALKIEKNCVHEVKYGFNHHPIYQDVYFPREVDPH